MICNLPYPVSHEIKRTPASKSHWNRVHVPVRPFVVGRKSRGQRAQSPVGRLEKAHGGRKSRAQRAQHPVVRLEKARGGRREIRRVGRGRLDIVVYDKRSKQWACPIKVRTR
jgi:hypothetical protein